MDGLRLVICQRIFRLQRKGIHGSEVEFLRWVLKNLPKKEAVKMDGKVEISLDDLIDVRVSIKSCAEALSISGKYKMIVAILKDADEVLRCVMYEEE